MSQQQWNIVEEKKNKYGRQFIKKEEKKKKIRQVVRQKKEKNIRHYYKGM